MKITDNALTARDIDKGDIVIEEGTPFMIVQDGITGDYGYMNLTTGVVLSVEYRSAKNVYEACFSPDKYDTKIRLIDEITLKSL